MNILELDNYRLSDAVKFNPTLNPRLWDKQEHLRPDVREALLKIAADFSEFLGISDLELKDITLSGSNAAYTYTPASDIDLHLVVDLPEADRNEVYRELFDAKKYQYNDMHSIKIGGYDVELYVQNANQPHHSQGIYSVLRNEWTDVPKRRKPAVDDVSTRSKYEDLSRRIDAAIESGSVEQLTAMAKKIRELRQAGLDQHGEFGPENLAFKMLRTQGKIKQLYAARNAAKDKEMSLRERAPRTPARFVYGFKSEDLDTDGVMMTRPSNMSSESIETEDLDTDGVMMTRPSNMSSESQQDSGDAQTLHDFVQFCSDQLKLKELPVIKLRRDPQWPVVNKTFGRYIDDRNLLEVAFGQRHIMDVLRTVAHELTHRRQHEREDVPGDAGETGSDWENEANARAGILMRDYGQQHPDLFDNSADELGESASGYIPTRKQAKDPRYSMALTQDIRPGQLGKEANKLNLKTNKQGIPQVAQANGLFEKLSLELARFKADEDYSPDAPPGPEFKPTMPAGTVRVDVSDVYDWYKLGQHISNMKGLGKHDFGKGPPASIISFGDEDTEHEFIQDLEATGLDVTDIDPVDPAQPKGMRKIKTDPTYNVAESVEQLAEVNMSPGALAKFAASEEAQGIRAGFEAELIFRDTSSGDDDNEDMEPDYDADERVRSIQGIIDFFQGGDFGYLSDRAANRLQEQLDEKYFEWQDEQMFDSWRDERDELIREAWLKEKPMAERIHAYLVDGMDFDDKQADAIQELANQREAGKIKGSEMSEEQLDMISAYSEARSGAEEILEEEVEQTIEKQDGFYDEVLDEFRDGFYVDDDSGFFRDIGLSYMSDVANEYSLDWPYMTGGNGNDGARDWDSIGDSLNAAIDMPVKVSSGYHSATRKEGLWIVEPDSSLEPDEREDYGLEIVSPPMPLLTTIEKLQQVVDWANNPSEGNAYSNSSTGLHMGVSVPYKGGNVDYLKLILFLGDEYVLRSFGREANTYTKSAMKSFRENIRTGRADVAGAMKLMQSNLLEMAQREIQKGVGTSKYTSAHIQDGYIEFRSAGGDWLAKADEDIGILENTLMRYAKAMFLASRPDLERREYAKKLYKLVAPEGDSQLALFSQYASGELTAEQLKQKWAEKTIGTEKKMNQRWKLYQKIDGRWEPVPGGEWNGYSEDQVKNAVWSKYGREALDSGEYQLVNMGEQSWEVYDVKTGKTLEVVKGKSKGEVADAVYDKYVNQGIGFNVRPYEDPDTMTPRAKLAKRIAQPKPQTQQAKAPNGVPYWNIVDRDTGNVVHTLADHDRMNAYRQGMTWLRSMGAESGYEDRFGVEPKMNTSTPIKDMAPDVAQNFAPDYSAFERNSDRIDAIRARAGQNATVEENFADGKGPGRPGDSQRHGIPKGATMAQLEKAAKAPGRKGQLARWQINMRRGKKK